MNQPINLPTLNSFLGSERGYPQTIPAAGSVREQNVLPQPQQPGNWSLPPQQDHNKETGINHHNNQLYKDDGANYHNKVIGDKNHNLQVMFSNQLDIGIIPTKFIWK